MFRRLNFSLKKNWPYCLDTKVAAFLVEVFPLSDMHLSPPFFPSVAAAHLCIRTPLNSQLSLLQSRQQQWQIKASLHQSKAPAAALPNYKPRSHQDPIPRAYLHIDFYHAFTRPPSNFDFSALLRCEDWGAQPLLLRRGLGGRRRRCHCARGPTALDLVDGSTAVKR